MKTSSGKKKLRTPEPQCSEKLSVTLPTGVVVVITVHAEEANETEGTLEQRPATFGEVITAFNALSPRGARDSES